MIKGGYAGKLLRVDLSKDSITKEDLPEEDVLRKYLGGLGLATKIAYDEVPPTVKPLDPESRVIFMAGPLSGTVAPCSSRHTILAAPSHSVPKMLGTAWGGGKWAAWLKFAGFDGIIIQGASEEPVYLWVHEGEAELRDADKIWGKWTHETEDLVKEELGEPDASVACIGPAGENMIKGALVANDKNHLAAKSGGGAILGAKKLKAIAVGGRKRGVAVSDPRKAAELAMKWRRAIFGGGEEMGISSYAVYAHEGGTPRKYKFYSDIYITLAKNLSDPEFGQIWTKAIMDTVKAGKHTPRACFNCPVACAWDLEIKTGPYKGYTVTLAGGAEHMEGPGCNLGITDGGTSLYMTEIMDQLGFDAAGTGNILGMAFECYEKGLLTKDMTDGLELKWGNADAAIELLKKMVKREGFGKVCAGGMKSLAEYIGGDAIKYAFHVKGSGGGGHDYRRSWESILGLITASAPWAIQGLGVDIFACEPDLGYTTLQPCFVKERTVTATKGTQTKKLFEDSTGVCWFSCVGIVGSKRIVPEMVSHVVGWDFTEEEAWLLGERVTTLQRVFNLRRGLTVEDDFDFGPKLLEIPQPPRYKAEGHYKSVEPYLKEFVHGYYKAMGWDEETGVPLKETLQRLGLEELTKVTEPLLKKKED